MAAINSVGALVSSFAFVVLSEEAHELVQFQLKWLSTQAFNLEPNLVWRLT